LTSLKQLAAPFARILASAHRPQTRFIGQNLTKWYHGHRRAEHNWLEAYPTPKRIAARWG
jgi:hypothetical protein